MGGLLQDVRYGARMLMKAPVVSGVAALSLAVAIAANTGVFAVVQGFLLSPFPYADVDRIVSLNEVPEGQDLDMAMGVAVADFRDYVDASTAFESAFLYTLDLGNLTDGDAPEQVQVVRTTPGIFDVLGVAPSLGRGFRPDDGADGGRRVLVLEHDFWAQRFGGRSDVLGSTVRLDGEPYTVIGVMPEDFDMVPANVHVFRPSDFADQAEDRARHGYLAFARLAPGKTVAAAEAELAPLSRDLTERFPEARGGLQLRVMPIGATFPGPTDRRLVLVLAAVTLFGLLIACANVANLLLGRAEVRHREVAVRTALGAGRGRIVRQLLTESVLLGLVGGGVGVAMAAYLVAWFRGVMPAEMPAVMLPRMSVEVLAVTVAVAMGAGVLFGLAPALAAVKGDLREALGEAGRGGSAGRARRRIRNLFVVSEFAVALALLTGAGFLVQAFNELAATEDAYDASGILTFRLTVLDRRGGDDASVARYEEELLRSLREIPGVERVALMATLPRGRSTPLAPYELEGDPPLPANERPLAVLESVSPDYFDLLGIGLRAGRLPGPEDRVDTHPVVVLSRDVAEAAFPGEDPLGRTLRVNDEARTVVGVVENFTHMRMPLSLVGRRAMYVPAAQSPPVNPSFALEVRGGDPTAVAADVRAAVWAVESDQPVAAVRTLQAAIDESLAGPIAISRFLAVMAAAALILAAMGIYGVMAHTVVLQRHEIGIRMALGADRSRVLARVTASGMRLALVGMLLGLPLAYLTYRQASAGLNIFAAQLPREWMGVVALALVGAAAAATLLPAHRASTLPPVTALRDE